MPTKRNHAAIYRKVPKFLRELREHANVTQRELAQRIGQSQWWVARNETGSRRIDVAEFLEFCKGCKADPAEMIRELIRSRS